MLHLPCSISPSHPRGSCPCLIKRNAPAEVLLLEEMGDQVTTPAPPPPLTQYQKHISQGPSCLQRLRKPWPTSWPSRWPQNQATWPVQDAHKSPSRQEAALWSLLAPLLICLAAGPELSSASLEVSVNKHISLGQTSFSEDAYPLRGINNKKSPMYPMGGGATALPHQTVDI